MDLDALTGRRVRLLVGDPWNFLGPDGQNLVRGVVTAVVDAQRLWLLADHAVVVDGGAFRAELDVNTRHVGSSFGELLNARGVQANVSAALPERPDHWVHIMAGQLELETMSSAP